jgi:hypothetical protein
MSTPRYAIYALPAASSALWRFGTAVIGYDSRKGREISAWTPVGFTLEQWQEWTSEPRRYGFHATIVAPFELRTGFTEAELVETVDRFAALHNPLRLKPLAVTRMGSFIALCQKGPQDAVNRFASDIVTRFNRFRAPLSDFDLTRRTKPDLSLRQAEYLRRFGYPYVHEEYRFHMTLTGSLPQPALPKVLPLLEQAYADIDDELFIISTLCVLRQDSRSEPFHVIGEVLLEEEFTGLGAWR